MRKILIAVLLFTSMYLSTSLIGAQEPDFDFARAYQDYVFTRDVYESELSEYRLARSQYLQAKTLVSQSKARDATVEMLQARDDVVTAYLTAIRMRLIETDGVSTTIANGMTDRLDAEIAWYRDHKSRVSSAGSLEDLVADSAEARDQFKQTESLVYETLSIIADGKTKALRDDLSLLVSDARRKTFEIESNGDFNLSLIQRWIVEAEQKITRSLDKSIEAQTKVQGFYESRGDRLELFNEIINLHTDSYQLLQDGNNFLKEVISELT